MTARLPIVGGDNNDWGDILNAFLEVSHDAQGNLLPGSVSAALPNPIPVANLGGGTPSSSNYLRGDGTWAVPNSPSNATSSTPGLIQLSGDLGNSATSPRVESIQGVAISGTPSAGQTLVASSSSAASWTNASIDWVNVVTAFGADPTGVNDSTTAIQNAIDALPAVGGVVYVPPGTYKIASTITALPSLNQAIIIQGDGYQSTILQSYVTGDCIRMYNPNGTALVADKNWSNGSGVRNLGIDGTNAGDNSSGLHIGDILSPVIDVYIKNFTGTGSAGLLFDNTITWTEEITARAVLVNCTRHVVFTVTTGYNSFGYGDFDFTILTDSNQQDGVALLNGANVYHGRLKIRGDHRAAAAATSAAVLRLAGKNASGGPANNHLCGLNAMHLDIQMECQGSGNAPMTIYMDTTNFAGAQNNYGILDFRFGPSSFAPASYASGQFGFSGQVGGDTAIAPAGSTWVNVNSPVAYTKASQHETTGAIALYTYLGDVFTITLSENVTISPASSFFNGGKTRGVPQRVTVIITQAASGGPYTVAWPQPGSPSTSAPAVYWPGGIAPVMSTAPGAVDKYSLETVDGVRWYGTAAQASVSPLAPIATTGTAGFALQNATPNVLSWTAPNDGQLHQVIIQAGLSVASTETGGKITVNYTDPAGGTHTAQIFAASLAAGWQIPNGALSPIGVVVAPNTTVTLQQNTALTGGTATLFATMLVL